MKKNIFSLIVGCWLFIGASTSFAQKFSEFDKSPVDITYLRGKDKTPLVKIVYGRPQKKGRTVFGELEPFGKVWRTGANEATEIKFFKDAKVGGKDVKAGTYSLFTIPEKDKWTIIINSDTDIWGAYNYNAEKDIIRTEVKPQVLPNELEILNIVFKEAADKPANLVIAWDKVMVEVPIEFSNATSSVIESDSTTTVKADTVNIKKAIPTTTDNNKSSPKSKKK